MSDDIWRGLFIALLFFNLGVVSGLIMSNAVDKERVKAGAFVVKDRVYIITPLDKEEKT